MDKRNEDSQQTWIKIGSKPRVFMIALWRRLVLGRIKREITIWEPEFLSHAISVSILSVLPSSLA